jgi:hypothetical protein
VIEVVRARAALNNRSGVAFWILVSRIKKKKRRKNKIQMNIGKSTVRRAVKD